MCCKKWEYTIVQEWEHGQPQAVIAEYGKKGWELVGFTTHTNYTDSMREVLFTFILKRPVGNPADDLAELALTEMP